MACALSKKDLLLYSWSGDLNNNSTDTKETLSCKNISHFILERAYCCCQLRDRWRDICSERGLLLPISSSGGQWVPTLAPPCKLVRDDLIGRVSHARLRFSALVLIPWSPSGYTPVVPDCPDVLLYPCLLITTWRLVKAHGVTRNEPKIHVICYITLSPL